MITRGVYQLQVVPAFVHRAKFISCGIDGYTCTEGSGETSAIGDSGFMPGFVIDRLGLSRSYNSLLIAPVAYGQVLACDTATKLVNWAALSVGLQHASASGGTWTSYSTQDFLVKEALWRQTTATSTAAGFYSAVQLDVGLSTEIGLGGRYPSSATSTAAETLTAGTTSSGVHYYTGPGAAFDLGGAKRYVRALIHAHMWSTMGDTGVNKQTDLLLTAAAIFDEPGEAPPIAQVKRVLVTTGCST